MFCYQCEQTSKGTGCTSIGVCGKDPQVAALQDLLVALAKGLAQLAHRAAGLGVRLREVDRFVVEALFSTVTNVDFDQARFHALADRAVELHGLLQQKLAEASAGKAKGIALPEPPVPFTLPADPAERVKLGESVSIEKRSQREGADATGLKELIAYGLKGAAAYLFHARLLGFEDDEIYAAVHACLAFLTEPHSAEELTGKALEVGKLNLAVMELLDRANTTTYGHPEPTQARVSPVRGKCILVSGHDLKDLQKLLEQTAGKGVNVYTHGEMLPALSYPGLKKHKHLVGHYGTAWQNQHKEFEQFPGAILMTTNCLQRPRDSYKQRIFTTDLVGFPGVTHLGEHDYQPLIEAALAEQGFESDAPEKTITVGFGRNAVLSVADKVIAAVKQGQIRHFFLVGGCDGARPGRNYYTDFVQQTPKDTVVLTLAFGKYRFNQLELGDIGGIPRLLDVGQCNDAYSAIQIAVALASAFGTDVNHLPLSLVLSWYEQKAVAILLTLLHLGIKNIRIGPTLPAFVTPPVLKVLVDAFQLTPISTAEADLKACLG